MPITKHLSVPLLAIAISLPWIPLITKADAADRGVIVRTNSQGFELCRGFKQDGTSYWRATASGILEDGGGRFSGSGRSFHVATCFITRQECQKWVDRIHHLIAGIDELRHSGCSPRGR